MQTVIRDDFAPGLPGDLAVLPSFKSSARVTSHRAAGDIAPGDAVQLTSGNDSSVVAMPNGGDGTKTIGVAVGAHSNMPASPSFGSNTKVGVVTVNCPIGIVEAGPIRIAVKPGVFPKVGDLAVPKSRNAVSGYMEWDIAGASEKSRFRFETNVQRNGTAIIMVTDGDVMSAGYPHDVPVTGVTVAPKTASKAVGGTQQLTPTIAPTGATNKGVTYQSSNANVATVDASGLVTVVTGATTGQTATITVKTDDGGFTDTAVITVS